MKKILAVLILGVGCATAPPERPPSDLIVCGGEDVLVLDLRGDAPRKVWSWRAADRPEVPEPLRKKFAGLDECKPVDGGRRILVSASGGAVGVIERPSGRVAFTAAVPNAHSVELLPGDRLVAASSTHEEGHKLILFDLGVPDRPIATDELQGAHGAVWDADRGLLWALGEVELRAYRVVQDRFVRQMSRALPNPGGHDLRPVPGTSALLVTSDHHVWIFDRDLLTFRTHPRIGDLEHVKSVDLDLQSGALVYVQGTNEKVWWAERLKFLGPDRTVELPGSRLYKARWLGANVLTTLDR